MPCSSLRVVVRMHDDCARRIREATYDSNDLEQAEIDERLERAREALSAASGEPVQFVVIEDGRP